MFIKDKIYNYNRDTKNIKVQFIRYSNSPFYQDAVKEYAYFKNVDKYNKDFVEVYISKNSWEKVMPLENKNNHPNTNIFK